MPSGTRAHASISPQKPQHPVFCPRVHAMALYKPISLGANEPWYRDAPQPWAARCQRQPRVAVWHCPEHAQSGPEPLLQVRAQSLGVTGNVFASGFASHREGGGLRSLKQPPVFLTAVPGSE